MQFSFLYAAIAALCSITALAQTPEKKFFAHYMLGLTDGQTDADWEKDITEAQAVGIDGFALNAGPSDSWSTTQLDNAYRVAANHGFLLFISFDMACCGDWPVDQVAKFVNQVKDSSAQYKVDGKIFVSTFEGPGFAGNWGSVEAQTGDLFLVPDWSSLGPDGIKQYLDTIDGALSWDSWPKSGPKKDSSSDSAWVNALGGKTYMMGISPWFYTKLPQWNKNWMWGSESLWFDRLEQMLEIDPQLVEVITWNDFGESSYIGPIRQASIVSGAEGYVNNMVHDAWRAALPYYIAAWKAGSKDVTIPTETAIFWYRPSPGSACGADGTTCGQNTGIPASSSDCYVDAVTVMTLANSAGTVSVKIGGQGQDFQVEAGSQMVQLPFDGRTGEVTVEFKGASASGAVQISTNCGTTGYNAVAGKTA